MKLPKQLIQICEALQSAGGQSFLVGGAVRDFIMDPSIEPKDFDVEIFGMDYDEITEVVKKFGKVDLVGKHFGVLKMKDYDFSIPRRDIKTGKGHCGFEIQRVHTVEKASQRRDLTINAIYYDILNDKFEDPQYGISDIKYGILKSVNSLSFIEDPLRTLRVMQFVGRFGFKVDIVTEELVKMSLEQLRELPKERVFDELKKLLLKSDKPSIGFNWAKKVGIVKTLWPTLDILSTCDQSPKWHAEGDVWIHTLLVLDESAKIRDTVDDPLVFMLSCLLHDVGKTETTKVINGKITSRGHEEAGVPIAERFLRGLTTSQTLIDKVLPMVEHHLKPVLFHKDGASNKAIRKLALKCDIPFLCKVSIVDKLGRVSKEQSLDFVEWILDKFDNLVVSHPTGIDPILKGRHLIQRGMVPSKQFGDILDQAFEAQLDDVFSNIEEAKEWLSTQDLT